MIDHFPGLRTLRAFDAAAAQLNFSRAAESMGVTPAAISNQIKELEDQIGVELFQRTSRSMRLTRQGEIMATAAHEAIEVLTRALHRVRRMENKSQLRVSSTPSIAAKWLVPRLDRFMAAFPGADVRVDVSNTLVDFDREDVDIAIRFGNGRYPGLRADLLFQDTLTPVCAPSLITPDKPLRAPKDLLKYILIHLDWEAQGQPWPNWRMWMQAAGVKDFDDKSGLHFGQTALTIQAAINGQGIALGDSTLVADDIAAGRLIRPFDLALKAPSSFTYYVITRNDTSDAPMVNAFRDWCIAEAQQTNTSNAGVSEQGI
jgi:LysR family transcriptional regulator, glycine cleavage system transcriptional activator